MNMIALVPTKMIAMKKLCYSRQISIEEVIKKQFKCTDVVVSDLGGVFIYSGEEGKMLDVNELEDLANDLEAVLNK